MAAAAALLAIQLLTGPLGLAPCTVRLRVRVEPMKENRSIEVTLTSDAFSSASRQDLDGAHAATTQREQTYRDVPRGSYEIRAIVTRPPHKDVHAVTTFVCG
jgi:hypothetical protein